MLKPGNPGGHYRRVLRTYHAEYVAGLGHFEYHLSSGKISASLGARAIFVYRDMMKETAHDPHLAGIIQNNMQCTETIQSHIEFTRTYEGLGLHEPQWQDLAGCIHEIHLPESVSLILDIPDISLYADPMLQKVF